MVLFVTCCPPRAHVIPLGVPLTPHPRTLLALEEYDFNREEIDRVAEAAPELTGRPGWYHAVRAVRWSGSEVTPTAVRSLLDRAGLTRRSSSPHRHPGWMRGERRAARLARRERREALAPSGLY